MTKRVMLADERFGIHIERPAFPSVVHHSLADVKPRRIFRNLKDRYRPRMQIHMKAVLFVRFIEKVNKMRRTA
ncbi:hypothetical protein ACFSWD_27260 [Paenibacillus xanthanilyticus]